MGCLCMRRHYVGCFSCNVRIPTCCSFLQINYFLLVIARTNSWCHRVQQILTLHKVLSLNLVYSLFSTRRFFFKFLFLNKIQVVSPHQTAYRLIAVHGKLRVVKLTQIKIRNMLGLPVLHTERSVGAENNETNHAQQSVSRMRCVCVYN